MKIQANVLLRVSFLFVVMAIAPVRMIFLFQEWYFGVILLLLTLLCTVFIYRSAVKNRIIYDSTKDEIDIISSRINSADPKIINKKDLKNVKYNKNIIDIETNKYSSIKIKVPNKYVKLIVADIEQIIKSI